MLLIKINGSGCQMELDTGTAVSTMSAQEFCTLCPHMELQHTNLKLKTYTGEILHPSGSADVKIDYEGQKSKDTLYI